MKKVLLFLASGFEEIEALTVVDILRRGEVEVVMAGLINGPIEGRNGIKVLADVLLDEVNPDNFDLIVLPGGLGGTNQMKNDSRVRKIIEDFHSKKRLTAAICAAPTVLSAVGVLDGKRVTSYPSVKNEINAGEYVEDRVVVDENLITSRSPGTAMEFSLKLLEILAGEEVMIKVKNGVLAKD